MVKKIKDKVDKKVNTYSHTHTLVQGLIYKSIGHMDTNSKV